MKSRGRRHLYGLIVFVMLNTPWVLSQDSVPIKPNANLRDVAAYSDVRMGGELGTRYQAAIYNVLTRQDRY